MADKPILFSSPMVRALLAGTKTQTRRILKPQPSPYAGNPVPPEGRSWVTKRRDEPYFAMHDDQVHWCWWDEYNRQGPDWIKLRIAKGDRLYVRENVTRFDKGSCDQWIWYRAGSNDMSGWIAKHFPDQDPNAAWSAPVGPAGGAAYSVPSIHMPRWASRITLTVTDVRVERLQDCTARDAIAEGIQGNEFEGRRDYSYGEKPCDFLVDPRQSYRTLWESINGPGSWADNPWVAAYSFKVHRGNIDQVGAV